MPVDFLQLEGRRVLVMGVANRKSVAWHTSQVLSGAGAEVVYVVRNNARREQVLSLVGDAAVFVCDVEHEEQIDQLAREPYGGATYGGYGGVSMRLRSHGQSFMAVFENRFGSQGMYLMDEPEAALSPQWQVEFLKMLRRLERRGDAVRLVHRER